MLSRLGSAAAGGPPLEQSGSCAPSFPGAWVVGVAMDVEHFLFVGCSNDEYRGGAPRVPPVHKGLYAWSGKHAGLPALSSPSVLVKLGVLDDERFHLFRWKAFEAENLLVKLLGPGDRDRRGPPKDEFAFPAGKNELLLVYRLVGPCGGA